MKPEGLTAGLNQTLAMVVPQVWKGIAQERSKLYFRLLASIASKELRPSASRAMMKPKYRLEWDHVSLR